MTRKRFVKLLMAAGYDRNEANANAAYARKSGIEYSDAFIVYSKVTSRNISALCNAVRNIADMAAKVASAINKAAAAFSNTFRTEMEVTHE